MQKKNNCSKGISFAQIFRYSLRSFSRNYKKNIALIITVAAGLVTYIFMSSLMQGIGEQSVKNVVQYETGAVQLMNTQYFADPLYPLEDTIAFPTALQERLLAQKWIASPQLRFNAEILLQSPPFSTDGTLRFSVLAIDLKKDAFLFDSLVPFIEVANEKPSKESHEKPSTQTKQSSKALPRSTHYSSLLAQDGVLMGRWLADRLGAKVGYTIVLVAKGRGGFIEHIELDIVGIYNSPAPFLNRQNLIMSYAVANDYLQAHEYTTVNLVQSLQVPNDEQLQSDVGSLNLLLEEFANANTNTSTVDNSVTEKQAYTWKEVYLQRYDRLAWDYPRGLAFMYLFFIFIIAASGISNNTAMNIISRNKEIATLQAFGLTNRQLLLLYAFEMLYVGIIASILASIAGSGLMLFLTNKGLNYTAFLKDSTFGIPSSGRLYGSWMASNLLVASAVGIGFTLSVGIFVMLRLKRQYSNIIEMLRART